MPLNEILWNQQSTYPVLTVLQLLPLLSMALMILFRHSKFIVGLAVVLMLLELGVAIDLFLKYQPNKTPLQLAEHINVFGLFQWRVAVNGIAVLFILLSSLLTLLLIIYSRIRQLNPPGAFFAVLFTILASVQNMFVTQNLLIFSVMSALELLLIGYLLRHWSTYSMSGPRIRLYFQFMGTGALLLLTATIMLGWNYANQHNGAWSFDLHELKNTKVAIEVQTLIFFMMFYGLAIRIPLFPLHGWLPNIAQHGTLAITGVFLLGIKTGVFGLLHFLLPLFPDSVVAWQDYIVGFAVVGIFYAAILALMQTDLRRLLAFAVISHTSVMVIGLFTLNHQAIQGSVLLAVNLGLATILLLFMSGLIVHRTGTAKFSRLGGLFDKVPLIGIAFLIAGLSIIGMPGTPGFDAAHLMLEASIERFGALLTIAAAMGNVVAAGFLLWAFQRAFLAPRNDETQQHIDPVNRKEILLATSMILIILLAGFYSEPWLHLIENSVKSLDHLFNPPSFWLGD
ncbi:NADH-ubiquinone oxidoreductase chain M [hydrothermal vent metagenome]|uniref:NADH-ubiquinone oxidoreductase chain M n=1 Tax=hydrothermal vent metagenome TaxID=652676 RepID=A0A3B0YJ56_9ZZZZ